MARKKNGNTPQEYGEFSPSGKLRTAIIEGNTFGYKSVQYTDVDGMAMFEGDIILGKVADVDSKTEQRKREIQQGVTLRGITITGAKYRWPNCKVPYTIDTALPNQSRVTDAIAHWEAKTKFRFILRTNANASSYPDWVTFRSGSGCSSYVGKQGGQQYINLASGCSKGNTIHEIGHTIGLWHEHSREDRNAFVTIHWDKIIAGYEHNFNQQISDGDDVGAYDYGSIMHYPRTAFSTDGSETITPTDPSASIGQRTALSAGDIAAANSLCPTVSLCPAAPKTCPGAPIQVCPVSPKLVCPPGIKLACPPGIKQLCPPGIKQSCPSAPIQVICPPGIKLACPPGIKVTCPPVPKIPICPPSPVPGCAAGPTNKPWVGPEGYTTTYRLDPASGAYYSDEAPPPGMNQMPPVVININFHGYQPPSIQSDYAQYDPSAYENQDWTATEYPDPGEEADDSITNEESEAPEDFNPECSE
ncbi:Dot/Icm T4SS effector Zinc-dependent metalloprotease LegP [Chlorobium phaeobacteroides]|jgi:hypothetical protein|uniref:Peptidase M12A, astacin n=1 Tax=Chlorobium phaeobacteroides (strain DSM 266 / SMG 266 / 2430) TaxID=290317 RepID=A1BCJ9_CHLPD|nr:Dot/Icm T4SS effector Zinc-dependent metalloprotease LegP [Chlorobium phaeobacteroides]ABL64126.1 peptidase M12A, astacin [Chlorobium phaeobacteroides DSM 266]MBV5330428.1 peptidase M12 [Chlorobium sp.]